MIQKYISQIFLLVIWFGTVPLFSQIDISQGNYSKLQTISQRWELDSASRQGTFLLTAYKPLYFLPVRWSSKPNEIPHSGNTAEQYRITEGTDYSNVEVKFQFSFKTKLLQNILWGKADLWFGYTQISNWQVYKGSLSRPFREINYEPELILNVPVHFKILGFNGQMAGLALNHESNGKSLPYSRSWNRIIFHIGLENGPWNVYLRSWVRLEDSKDDNPDIMDKFGRADMNVIYRHKDQVFSLIGTHNLSFGTATKGNLNFSWSYPIKGNLKAYLIASHGYGETMIDYNHVQNTIGIGFSLIEWL
ncbi:phospholipase A [Flavobacterium sp. CSZ]|uniref:phospholipase A n=1 Tax=Flavobacterium sp. CSZ TaxID=2783791 RepID=UPI00188C1691|nr:phospholipase A [Flavobacterium sp. CSZ]MBF4485728.1 phospholipase A [Flavobacterium sp. CSZ]